MIGRAKLDVANAPAFGDPRLPPRFWEKVRLGPIPNHWPDLGPCWLWMGAHDRDGYGRFKAGSSVVSTHRLAYEVLVGPIPQGLESDHLCRNRACLNHSHIEPVTTRENILRGNGRPALYAKRIQCLKGHSFDEANTYCRSDRGRRCRACDRERKACSPTADNLPLGSPLGLDAALSRSAAVEEAARKEDPAQRNVKTWRGPTVNI